MLCSSIAISFGHYTTSISPSFWFSGSRLVPFLVAFLPVFLHDRARRHFFGALAIAALFLCRFLDVLVLALFLVTDAFQMFFLRHDSLHDCCWFRVHTCVRKRSDPAQLRAIFEDLASSQL